MPSPSQKRPFWIYAAIAVVIAAFVGVSLLPAGLSIVDLFSGGAAGSQQSGAPLTSVSAADRERDLEARGYEKVLEREPDNETALDALVRIRLEQGDFEAATGWLEKLAEHKSDEPDYRILLGQVREQTGDLEGAVRDFRRVLEENPGYLPALQGLTGLLLQQDRPEAAIGEVQAALALAEAPNSDVERVPLQLHLGQIYVQIGRSTAAIAIFDEIAAENPADFRPVLGKALVLGRQGRIQEAKELADRAQALAPARYKDQIQQLALQLDQLEKLEASAANSSEASDAGGAPDAAASEDAGAEPVVAPDTPQLEKLDSAAPEASESSDAADSPEVAASEDAGTEPVVAPDTPETDSSAPIAEPVE
ncbi:hypothetical protein KR51_00026180 [Rubidibacter lacunae KORDI 51-2]|uniref:Uncharacterized protein n=1 Tax=Rubidibacter lacunae KORDI 51-2 TaxID=582515 RepID=U5DGV9_9CHRO|nr:tetratricopeptide repeat protein [Rubidibacter lacunae]ERN40836.1 hypothetical protein KR51_00026180 [Rubidibacter lacunae KORDI 51-2]